MATPKDTYNGNGSQTLFQFTFPYLSTSDIKVTVDGADTTAYTFASATEIEFTTGNEPPTGVDNVVIYRDTAYDSTSATFYPGSSIRAQDLNNNFTQALYVNQESDLKSDEALEASRILESGEFVTAIEKANEAEIAHEAFVAKNYGTTASPNWVTRGNEGTDTQGQTDSERGVGYAVAQAVSAVGTAAGAVQTAGNAALDAADALSNSQDLNSTPSSAIDIAKNALSNSQDLTATPSSAIAIAQAAEITAGNALSNSQDLNATPSSAIDIAQAAAITATNALNNSQDLNSTPSSAIDIAAAATVTAGNAVNTAGNAVNTADAVEDTVELYVADSTGLKGGGTHATNDPQGVKYAVDKVNDWIINGDGQGSNQQGVPYAVATANLASAAVANSTTYTLRTTKATFEATIFDGTTAHENWEIGNSLGISSAYNTTGFIDGNGILIGQTVNGVAGTGTAKTVSGVPTTPTFDAGLSSRFSYDHANNAFAWKGYWVNDAEDRYGGRVVLENEREISSDYTIKDGMNAHSVGPVTIAHNGTNLTYNPENHATAPYVATNAATAGNTVTIPVNSTWLIN